jgi:hypothetical protein
MGEEPLEHVEEDEPEVLTTAHRPFLVDAVEQISTVELDGTLQLRDHRSVGAARARTAQGVRDGREFPRVDPDVAYESDLLAFDPQRVASRVPEGGPQAPEAVSKGLLGCVVRALAPQDAGQDVTLEETPRVEGQKRKEVTRGSRGQRDIQTIGRVHLEPAEETNLQHA